MMTEDRKLLAEHFARRTERLDTFAFVQTAAETFGPSLTLASSLGLEDQVLFHLLLNFPAVNIFTLDTGRLPQETLDVLAENRQRYGRSVSVLYPEAAEVRQLVETKGINLFYESVENRKACCNVRKVRPLDRHLAGFTAWMTGMRRQQSTTRTSVSRVEYDAAHNLVKLNPLADWTTEQVRDYLRLHQVPYNVLHDRGYPSLGCAPCTRAVAEGEDERAGRWWWELPEHKECGLHVPPAAKVFSFKKV